MSVALLREAASVLRHNARFPSHENPVFALAVADWLDGVLVPPDPHTLEEAEGGRCVSCLEYRRAEAVARAYLGHDS